MAVAEELADREEAGIGEQAAQRRRLAGEVEDAARVALARARRRPPRRAVVGTGRVDGAGEVGVDRVHLVVGEHALQEQEPGLGEEVRRVGGSLAEPEPLVEVERRAVERAQRDVAGPVHAAPVERGAQHGIPRAERLVRLGTAVDARADHETERGSALVHEVGERVAVERDLQRGRRRGPATTSSVRSPRRSVHTSPSTAIASGGRPRRSASAAARAPLRASASRHSPAQNARHRRPATRRPRRVRVSTLRCPALVIWTLRREAAPHDALPVDFSLDRLVTTRGGSTDCPGPSADCKRSYRRNADDVRVTNEVWGSAHELAVLAWEAWGRNHVGEAASLASRGSSAAAAGTRRERQEVEVVCVAIAGDRARARDLASEHLAEFPADDLVRRVQKASE